MQSPTESVPLRLVEVEPGEPHRAARPAAQGEPHGDPDGGSDGHRPIDPHPDPDRCSAASARRLVLTSEQRAKTRFRAVLSDGGEAIVLLPRGSVVRPGTRLVADNGEAVDVVAAREPIYRVHASAASADPTLELLRAAYHLGNRHVPVELGAGVVRLQRDPVLRDLLRRLGLIVDSAFEPFDPEPGAYGGGHRHDADVDGGSTGEALSRSAHAAAAPADGSAT